MKRVECDLESEVLAAVLQNRWPERVEPSLRAHVEACEICASTAAVAGVIDQAREETRAKAEIPDPGRVWWVAQMRARREAAKSAGRPITAAQVIALACAMGLLGACFGATSAWFQAALKRVESSVAGLDLQTLLPSAAGFMVEHTALLLGMAAIILLIPAVVYLTMLRD
ncbi:MAG: hypothetical protein U0Q18_13520 [Bryobacteraceae bacterium]